MSVRGPAMRNVDAPLREVEKDARSPAAERRDYKPETATRPRAPTRRVDALRYEWSRATRFDSRTPSRATPRGSPRTRPLRPHDPRVRTRASRAIAAPAGRSPRRRRVVVATSALAPPRARRSLTDPRERQGPRAALQGARRRPAESRTTESRPRDPRDLPDDALDLHRTDAPSPSRRDERPLPRASPQTRHAPRDKSGRRPRVPAREPRGSDGRRARPGPALPAATAARARRRADGGQPTAEERARRVAALVAAFGTRPPPPSPSPSPSPPPSPLPPPPPPSPSFPPSPEVSSPPRSLQPPPSPPPLTPRSPPPPAAREPPWWELEWGRLTPPAPPLRVPWFVETVERVPSFPPSHPVSARGGVSARLRTRRARPPPPLGRLSASSGARRPTAAPTAHLVVGQWSHLRPPPPSPPQVLPECLAAFPTARPSPPPRPHARPLAVAPPPRGSSRCVDPCRRVGGAPRGGGGDGEASRPRDRDDPRPSRAISRPPPRRDVPRGLAGSVEPPRADPLGGPSDDGRGVPGDVRRPGNDALRSSPSPRRRRDAVDRRLGNGARRRGGGDGVTLEARLRFCICCGGTRPWRLSSCKRGGTSTVWCIRTGNRDERELLRDPRAVSGHERERERATFS